MSQEFTLTGSFLRTLAYTHGSNGYTVVCYSQAQTTPVGMIFIHVGRLNVQWPAGTGKIRIGATWTASGTWETGVISTPEMWRFFALTYGFGSTANQPAFYFTDATSTGQAAPLVGRALTQTAVPSGTAGADGGDFRCGTNSVGANTFQGGKLGGYFAVWRGQLTSSEIHNIYVRGPFAHLQSLQILWPLTRIEDMIPPAAPTNWYIYDHSGNGRRGDISGCTFRQDEPRLYTPVGGMVTGH